MSDIFAGLGSEDPFSEGASMTQSEPKTGGGDLDFFAQASKPATSDPFKSSNLGSSGFTPAAASSDPFASLSSAKSSSDPFADIMGGTSTTQSK